MAHSEETKRKMSESKKGHTVSQETRDKIRKKNLGRVVPEEEKKAISVGLKKAYKEGRRKSNMTDEVRNKISETLKRKGIKPKNCEEKGRIPWNKNISGNREYSYDWNDTLKRAIRERDGFTCQVCKKEWDEDKDVQFDVHHIDYDKENCNPNNLITLCKSCHSKTGGQREFWEKELKGLTVYLGVRE